MSQKRLPCPIFAGKALRNIARTVLLFSRAAIGAMLLAGLLSGCGNNNPTASRETKASLPGGAQMEMVQIDPGQFEMGSPDSDAMHEPDETPQHGVTITRGFFLGKYEVTQKQWKSVMGTTPWVGVPNVTAGASYPAVAVSWFDVQDFMGRLNAAAGDSLFRLPTEAEWEYACRAGTTTRWPFGNNVQALIQYAWYYYPGADAPGAGAPREVGLKRPNRWGLYDMLGNVREWVHDWYSDYYADGSLGTDPQGPASGTKRVVRGGYWRDEAQYVRCATRFSQVPEERNGLTGFRVLREAR